MYTRAVFIHSRKELDKKKSARMEGDERRNKKHEDKLWFFPVRPLACMRPKTTKVVLPRGNEDVNKLWNFYCENTGLSQDQAIWVTHNGDVSLEEAIMAEPAAVEQIKAFASHIIPYQEREHVYDIATEVWGMAKVVCDNRKFKLSLVRLDHSSTKRAQRACHKLCVPCRPYGERGHCRGTRGSCTHGRTAKASASSTVSCRVCDTQEASCASRRRSLCSPRRDCPRWAFPKWYPLPAAQPTHNSKQGGRSRPFRRQAERQAGRGRGRGGEWKGEG